MFDPQPFLMPGVVPHRRKFKVFVPSGKRQRKVYIGIFNTVHEANAAARAEREKRGLKLRPSFAA